MWLGLIMESSSLFRAGPALMTSADIWCGYAASGPPPRKARPAVNVHIVTRGASGMLTRVLGLIDMVRVEKTFAAPKDRSVSCPSWSM